MVHYKLRNNAQFNGGWTDLFILGSTRAYDATTRTWGSDFTAAATTQSYNLIALSDSAGVPLYIVNYGMLAIIKAPTSNSAHNLKLDVGQTGSATAFIAGTASDCETLNKVVLPVAAAVPFATTTASQYLTALVTSASGNVSTLAALDTTKGIEFLIYANLSSYRGLVTDREG